ncbi:tol-pal system YbgF family protein [Seleniivibrio woodruffii]|uniref:tetratricopeptide repeat protein n=1 Tax=Seleniivibrio woodruffii TaxID=1078050 RepID=UPI0026ECF0E5|nr:tetratricopeptide repeat protein [Seleniivibrio woodruffii]
MRKLFGIFLISLLCANAWAAGIYLRSKGHFSELVITGIADKVMSVSKGSDMLAVESSVVLSGIDGTRIKDPFIRSIAVNGRILTISLFPGNDYTVNTRGKDFRLVVAKKKQTETIKTGYGIEKPIATKDMLQIENTKLDTVLSRIDGLMASKNYTEAMNLAESVVKSQPDGYYKQEAYFRQGLIYLYTGKENYNNYVFASQVFDNFLKQYPDSFRKKDAMIKSAEAKESAQLYNEAIFAYNNVIKTLRAPDVIKTAYERIADIYTEMGKYKDAIETRRELVSNFKSEAGRQSAQIGMLQAKMKDYDLAYSSFLTVMNSGADLEKLGPEVLYTMAEVFENKSQPETARGLYEKVYSRFPSSREADMAAYRSAMLLKTTNPQIMDARLEYCSKTFGKKKGGMLCSVAYAARHLAKKTSDQWADYLKVPLASQDIDLRSEAEILIIRSLFREGQYDAADRKVAEFIKRNYTSDHLQEIYNIRQRILLTKAKDAYQKSNYAQAKTITDGILKEYPDTPYKKEALEILQDISFGNIRDLFKAGKYKDTVDRLNKYLAENPDLVNPSKWLAMLEEAKYNYTKQVYAAKNYNGTITVAGEYLVSFPNGKHKDSVRKMLESAISAVITDSYRKQAYIQLVGTYDKNQTTILTSRNPDFRDRMNSYAAFALYKLGMSAKAEKILDRNKNGKNPYYVLTSLMLGRAVPNANPNIFSTGMMDYLVQELEKKNPDLLLHLLSKYTKDPAYAAKETYDISKGVFDDIKREKMLFDLYMKVDSDPKARFKGYDEIYLDTGISFFKRNNFDSAVKVLEQFKLIHTPRDDKRAEGLYYLGKAYQKMGKADQSRNAYMELMETVPKSVYASAAKSELEDTKWRNSLKN